jgi:phosphodiesterase/alkaline phosphatase D-like protein
VVAPILRDVQLTPPRSGAAGSQGRTTEALVSCYTGRASTNCYVEVEYGPTTAYGTTTPRSPTGGVHELPVGGLTPGGYYHFRVKATDPTDAGNPTYSQDYAWTQPTDEVPPGPTIVNQPMTGITATTATVNWTTTPAQPPGTVQYSVNPNLVPLLSATETGGTVTTHTRPLTGLTATTRYYYRIVQPGAVGGATVGSLQTFVTT